MGKSRWLSGLISGTWKALNSFRTSASGFCRAFVQTCIPPTKPEEIKASTGLRYLAASASNLPTD